MTIGAHAWHTIEQMSDPFRSSLGGAKAKLHALSSQWESRRDRVREVELSRRVEAIQQEHKSRTIRAFRDGVAMALGFSSIGLWFALFHWRAGEVSWLLVFSGFLLAVGATGIRQTLEQRRFVEANAEAQTELGVLEKADPVRERVAIPAEIDALDNLDEIQKRIAETEEELAAQDAILAGAKASTDG